MRALEGIACVRFPKSSMDLPASGAALPMLRMHAPSLHYFPRSDATTPQGTSVQLERLSEKQK